jgi:hypothetical protein
VARCGGGAGTAAGARAGAPGTVRVVVMGAVSAANSLRTLISPFASRSTWILGFVIVMLFAAARPGYEKSTPSIATLATLSGPDVAPGARSSRLSIQLRPRETAIVSLPSVIATRERLSPLNTPTMRPGIGRYG